MRLDGLRCKPLGVPTVDVLLPWPDDTYWVVLTCRRAYQMLLYYGVLYLT